MSKQIHIAAMGAEKRRRSKAGALERGSCVAVGAAMKLLAGFRKYRLKALFPLAMVLAFALNAFSQNPEFIYYKLNVTGYSDAIISICPDSSGNIWCGDMYSIYKYNFKEWKKYINTDGTEGAWAEHLNIVADKQNRIVISHEGGVYIFNNDKFNKSLKQSIFSLIVLDSNYVGGSYDNNLYFFDGNQWILDNTGNQFQPESISAISLDSNGFYWLGSLYSSEPNSSEGRIFRVKNKKWDQFIPRLDNPLVQGAVRSIVCSKDMIWVGKEIQNGLFSYSTKDSIWTRWDTSKTGGIALDYIIGSEIDSKGNIWFIGEYSGLFKYNGTNWYKIDSVKPPTSYPYIYSMRKDKYDNIWLGFSDGIGVYREGGVIINVEEEKKNTGIELSPNPASDFIYLNKGLQPLVPGEQIKIYNTLGECVMTLETGLRPVSTKIDVSGLPAGVYFCRMQAGGEVLTSKFVVVR